MNTVVVGSEAVDLLSRITGQKLSQRDLTSAVTDLLTMTAPLSEAERLLLIGFSYEMSAADGAIAPPEKKYLEAIANRLGINPRHLAVLEAGFSNRGTVEPGALDEVRFLLDPAQFQSLDAMFVKAASDMLTVLGSLPEHQGTQQQTAWSYQEFKKFQEYRQQLETACDQLIELIDQCATRSLVPHTLIEETRKVSHKLRSQRFRVAVVGEFSQGKSTLLNALLGEEIQPVRAIPCSGTVTILKYGAQKRVVCRYQDGREEEIPFEQYQDKAAIPEDAAMDCFSGEQTHFDIEEIIFEHPDLELCRHGVEIVDSSGLNENPDRTAITQKLLKDTDAAIFLTNASRSLTQGERDLLQDLRTKLNGGKDEPADNLFIVGNFMDLVRTEKDRHQVQQRIERFVQGQNPIIAGENRVHFISAQAALDAIIKGSDNEYLKTFQNFTQSLEKFLVSNRSGGDQKNVQYEITRNQYENQSRLDLYRIIVSSQKCYTGLQIVF